MTAPKPTRDDLAKIQRELLAIEHQMQPDFRHVPLDCFPTLGYRIERSEIEELQEINQQIYRRFSRVSVEAHELRREAASQRAWAWIGWSAAALLLVAFLGLLAEVL